MREINGSSSTLKLDYFSEFQNISDGLSTSKPHYDVMRI